LRRADSPRALICGLALGLFGCARHEPGVATGGAAGTAAAGSASAAAAVVAPGDAVQRLRPRVLATWPHERSSFTQGLLWHRGTLYESIGLYGKSALRRLELETGAASSERRLAPAFFGEGLALGDGELVQLTWREGVAFRFDPESLAPRGEFHYTGEGWGLAFDGRRYVRSDGSDILRFHDAVSFSETGKLAVTLNGRAADRLNELEWSAGALYANRWQTDEILRIDPASGRVTAVIDASDLLAQEDRAGADVLNGIACDPARGVFYLTGKLWPKLFEVVFEPAP